MNVLIVCGGTGGHLFPGMAVGEELLQRHHQVLLVLSEKEIDRVATRGATGFLVQNLPAVGWTGLRPDRALRFGWRMLVSLRRTRTIFRSFQPDVVVGMGGFSSFPPLFLASLQKVPTCIHESNVIAGKANRLLARYAKVVAVGFEAAREQFPKSEVVCTGTPIRGSLRATGNRTQVRRPGRFTVLVIGGSQGAKGLNRLVTDAARMISGVEIHWEHVTGVTDEAGVRDAYVRMGAEARVQAFCHEMQELYASADLIIARSGAASLAEIAEWSLPSVLIPFPFAADQHQTANARIFHDAGAAVLRQEADCGPQWLAKEIQDILTNDLRRKKMIEATKPLRHENAHGKLADMIEDLAGTTEASHP